MTGEGARRHGAARPLWAASQCHGAAGLGPGTAFEAHVLARLRTLGRQRSRWRRMSTP